MLQEGRDKPVSSEACLQLQHLDRSDRHPVMEGSRTLLRLGTLIPEPAEMTQEKTTASPQRQAPTLTIIGELVRLREQLQWHERG